MKRFVIFFFLLFSGLWAFQSGIFSYLDFEYLKSQRNSLELLYETKNSLFTAVYFFSYIIATAFSIPGAAILTLFGGFIFGFWKALVLISFASSIGASLAFLLSRYFLRDLIKRKFPAQSLSLDKGFEKDGAFYLFALRMVPLFPFFMVNLLMGLSSISLIKFYIVSQVGMLAGTAVYVNAGRSFAEIESLSGLLSLELLLAFSLLGIFPLLAKSLLEKLKAMKVYRPYKRPKKFDFNLIVIGAGAAGLVTTYIAAAVKSKVLLIEKNKMGGDCLNTGCVPSKALLKSAKLAKSISKADDYGFENLEIKLNFSKLMARIFNVIKKIEPHDSVQRYRSLGADCISGKAKLLSPWEVEVNGEVFTGKSICIATGASPFVPEIPGLDEVGYFTSETIWSLKELPEKLTVLGAGPIGCELAQAFARLGSEVTLIEREERVLLKEDPEFSMLLETSLLEDGIKLKTGYKVTQFMIQDGAKFLAASGKNGSFVSGFDHLLIAIGRKANVTGFGLEELGLELDSAGRILSDDYLRTNFPNIYACGDVTAPYQLTHTASHQAWYASVNSLFGMFRKFKVDYRVIPWATFTDPEIARVGLSETEAKEANIDFEVTSYGIDDLDRAIADGNDRGLVKVITEKGSDRILGASIAGENAAELITEFVSAMKHNYGLNKILSTIHIYPTMSESNKYVAGNWKRKMTSEKVLNFLSKFHKWQRGG